MPTLKALRTEVLQAELMRRRRSIAPLQKKRDRLMSKVALIDRQLAALGEAPTNGVGRGGTRRRAVNKQPLVDALYSVMKGKTMSVGEAAEAVQKAGYKTYSSTFKVMVNMTLAKFTDRFKRVGRGQYTTK
jgi:hypothetical protein